MNPTANIAATIDDHARQAPGRIAIRAAAGDLTYRDAAAAVARIAARLLASGLARGDVVAVLLGKNAAHLLCLLAIGRAGLVALHIDPAWPTARQADMIARHGARRVLAEPGTVPTWTNPTDIVDAAWIAGTAGAVHDAQAEGDAPFLLAPTSGTTGPSKLIPIGHAQFLAWIAAYRREYGHDADDTIAITAPLHVTFGRTWALSALWSGATVVLTQLPFDARETLALLARSRATKMQITPDMLRQFLALDDAALAPLRGLRCLLVGGSAVDGAEKREAVRRIGAGFAEGFATTECGLLAVLRAHEMADRGPSVGRPLRDVAVKVADESGADCAVGETGALGFRSPAVPVAALAAAGRIRDGWFMTGDMGFVDRDGYLHIVGRSHDLLDVGGNAVWASDIAAVLREAPGVIDAAVIGVPASRGDDVIAFVVLRDTGALDAVRRHCRLKLAPAQRPTRLIALDRLPLNAGGKVMRDALRRLLEG